MSRATRDRAPELVDIRQAAGLVGRHPETVRRWVWSGRLAATRRGSRLLVDRADGELLAGGGGRGGGGGGAVRSLAVWAERARKARETATCGSGRSAADLVIEDRAHRSPAHEGRAGR